MIKSYISSSATRHPTPWEIKEEVIYPAGEPGEAVENIFIAHYIIPLALTAETLFMGLFGLILLCVFRKTKG